MIIAASYYWLAIALLFVIIEIGHPALFLFLSCSFGALCGAVSAQMGAAIIYQIALMLIGSFLTFIIMSILVRMYGIKHLETKTNVYGLIGKEAIVINAINYHEKGSVKLGSEVWIARSVSRSNIPNGELVRIVQVQGAHLIVEIIKKKD
jgi:membrane protein implicated in regulation of membrane protease activity